MDAGENTGECAAGEGMKVPLETTRTASALIQYAPPILNTILKFCYNHSEEGTEKFKRGYGVTVLSCAFQYPYSMLKGYLSHIYNILKTYLAGT